ncbi:hypothetical protein O3P69_016152 [Scylla paramamosain]|uniref:Uncharacterized protein n=1 Tax=Scylla paramamosain TaxID=85552 RepID=A0AAW0SGG2_SCYPA
MVCLVRARLPASAVGAKTGLCELQRLCEKTPVCPTLVIGVLVTSYPEMTLPGWSGYSPECCSSAYEEDFVRLRHGMWKRAVWLEGKKEEEGVVPSSWVLEENQTLFWPQGVNAENALHNQQEPDPASWRKFMLKKVKITSDSFQECDTYHLTSTVESSESNSDPDEGLLMRKRRKRCKKNLPDDFVSSENLHEAVHMKPASQKPQVTTSQDKIRYPARHPSHLTTVMAVASMTGDIMTRLTKKETMIEVTILTTMTGDTMTHLTEEEAMTKESNPGLLVRARQQDHYTTVV